VVAAIKHFRYMLEGRPFTVFTYHRPLARAFSQRSDPLSSRQQRHLSFIAEFSPTIRHIASQSNVVADTLSRPAADLSVAASVAQSEGQHPLPPTGGSRVAAGYRAEVNAPSGSSAPFLAAKSVQVSSVAASSPPPASPVDLAALAAAQPTCPDCCRAPFSSSLRVTTIQMDNTSIMVDTSSGVFRPLVPAAFHRPIFDVIHGLAHPGIRATRRLIASRFVWPGLASQVAAWCPDCQHCQRAKVVAQPSSPPQSIANPLQRFSHLHLDLVGPLPESSEGYTHLLTVVDHSTRWAEAVPLRSTAADSYATALIGSWIARFGFPQRITSDRGPQFTSAVWSALTSKLGIKSQLTSPYHPQSNGASSGEISSPAEGRPLGTSGRL
jgi:hypothetical protein